jgi:hypothetical protein
MVAADHACSFSFEFLNLYVNFPVAHIIIGISAAILSLISLVSTPSDHLYRIRILFLFGINSVNDVPSQKYPW